MLHPGASGAEVPAATLDAEDVEIRVDLLGQRGAMLELLRAWVDTNTGTWNLSGLSEFAGLLAAPLAELGFAVELRDGPELDYPGRGRVRTGPIVLARREPDDLARGAPRFLLVGHYDTVFEPDSAFQRLHVDPNHPDRAVGPGAADMKGGLVVLVYALQALAESGDLDRASFTVLLNADEEIGSLATRALIESEARRASVGLVFESARRGGAMVRSRRGLGQFYLVSTGRAAHAGSAHRQGRSAVLDLAHKVIEIESITDYEKGITVNTGTFQGGTKRNIVPERAEVWVDLRYDEPEQGQDVRRRLEEIAATSAVPDVRSSVWGTLHRPPKRETAETRALLERHEAIARALGLLTPDPIHAGGGTDGSLMGAVGLPTLDSMGVRGARAHTDREFVIIASLPERAALAALLMRSLMADPPAPHTALRPGAGW